jgi:hypothetical protein
MRPFGEMFLLVQRVTRKHSFRAAPRALAISTLIVGSLGVTVALAGPAAGSGGVTLYVNSTGSDASNDCTQLLAPCATVSNAVSQAATGDTIEVVGTIEDNVTVPATISTLTISGDEAPAASPAVLDGAGSGTVVTVANGSNVTLNYLTIQHGSSAGSGGGIENNGTLTVNDSTVTNNFSTGANGAGIDNTGTFTVSNSTISDNTANQNGGGISSEGGTVTVSDSTISGNTAGAAGGGVDLVASPGLITDSTIAGNTAASGGGINNGSSGLTVIDATISSNSSYGIVGSVTTGATIVAYDSPADCQSAITSTGFDLSSDSSCGFTATGDSESVDPQLGGLTDNGGPTQTLLPASISPAVGVIPNSTMLDSSFPVCGGTTDQRGVNRPFGASSCNIGAVESFPGVAPRISNIPQAAFDVGLSSSFQFTTSAAAPAAIFTETGALPAGVTLNRAGVLSGTPPAAAVRTYPIVVTASNGVTPVPSSTQNFTLMVNMVTVFPPSNAPQDAFVDGTFNTFTFTATGTPTPEVTASLAPGLRLPVWLTVHPGAGSATLSGTPPVGTKHIFVFTVKATNTAVATQTFTLTVGYAPKFLSLAAKTFKVGSLLNQIFASRTSGYPAPTITETGQLPNGLSFSPLPNGKSEIIGIAQPGSGGVYNISLAATNVFGTVTQQVVLTVDEKPTITSPASATVTHGTPISIAVATSHAYPAVTNITETSALPPGVTFTYTGNGTGMLAGTPTATRVTPYHLQFVALTPIAHAAQTFYLTVN